MRQTQKVTALRTRGDIRTDAIREAIYMLALRAALHDDQRHIALRQKEHLIAEVFAINAAETRGCARLLEEWIGQ